MRTITLGLALSLLGGIAVGSAALAQQAPPAPKPPAPGAPPTPPAQLSVAPQPQQQAGDGGPGQAAAQNGPPEGMVVETPNGLYLVRPGDQNPRRLGLGQDGAPKGQNARMGQNDPSDDASMDDTADDGLQPPPPHGPRGPMPPRPPEGQGARFRIRTPNLTLGMKCPDDEPIKACVDAVSQLLDKAGPPAH